MGGRRERSPRRGGRLQRLAVARASAIPVPIAPAPVAPPGGLHQFDSEQAFASVSRWCWGLDSATDVQRDCASAYRDQIRLLTGLGIDAAHASKSLAALAALGAHGRHKSNIKGQLVTLLGDPRIPEPHFEDVPMLKPKPAPGEPLVETISFPILLPHEQFAYLYHNHPERFRAIFLNGEPAAEVLPVFWKQAIRIRDPRLQHHPMCADRQWTKQCVPLSLHGDAAPCVAVGHTGTKSFDVYSMQGLLSQGSTKDVKVYLMGLFEQSKVDNTMDAIWLPLIWSFKALASGRWPEVDHRGQPYRPGSIEHERAGTELAEGLRGVLWALKADLDHLAKSYHLRHYNSEHPCEFCPAHNHDTYVPMKWNNFKKNARWKVHKYNTEQWRLVVRTKPLHPLFSLPYLTHHNIEVDELHVIYLGVAATMLGSVLWCLCYEIMSESPANNMHRVWSSIVRYYRDLGTPCQYSSLSLSSFCDPSSPSSAYAKLKGRGAEIKDMVRPLLLTFRDFRRHDNEEDAWTEEMLMSQLTVQDMLSETSGDFFLSESDVATVRRCVDRVLQMYTLLANRADQRGVCLYNMIPKTHFLWHFADKCCYLHPRKGNTMIDEDYVGLMKKVVQSCVSATSQNAVPESVMEKVRWGQHFAAVYGAQFRAP